MSETLRDRIKRHEGFDPNPYPDAGGLSIGYGCRLPLTKTEAEWLFIHRFSGASAAADRILNEALPRSHELTIVREGVIVEMCFQLGERGVRRFVKFLAALKADDYETAADEMIDSDVGRKQPERWGELAAIMRTGAAA